MAGKLANARYQERQKKILQLREKQLSNDLRALLEKAWGRRLVYWLIFELGGLEAPVFMSQGGDGMTNALLMAKAEGTREMAGDILAQVQEINPESFLRMLKEQIEWRQKYLELDGDLEDNDD